MDTLKINGKDYKFNVSWGKFKRVIKKDGQNPGDNLINYIWAYIRPRFWFIKPFLTKRRMADRISFRELQMADKIISESLKMEDGDRKNSDI